MTKLFWKVVKKQGLVHLVARIKTDLKKEEKQEEHEKKPGNISSNGKNQSFNTIREPFGSIVIIIIAVIVEKEYLIFAKRDVWLYYLN